MKSTTLCLVGCLIFLLPSFLSTQEKTAVDTPTWRDYRVVQFISCQGTMPKSIIAFDNNADLVLACRQGKTRKQLKETGIAVTESQIELLRVYGLLARRKEILKTAFPILGSHEMQTIRQATRRAAADITAAIKKDINELVAVLKQRGLEKNTYSILFAYVMDGMVWDDFYDRHMIHPFQITAKHPFWSGEFWAYTPEREFSCGTNTTGLGDLRLKVNWNRDANRILNAFYAELSRQDRKKLSAILEKGVADDPAVRSAFAPFGIFDESGGLRLPVIREKAENLVFTISRRIAKKTVEQSLALLPLENMKKEFGFRDVQQALVIAFHELMWDIMAELEARKLVRKPVAFRHPERSGKKDAADLMFLVKSRET